MKNNFTQHILSAILLPGFALLFLFSFPALSQQYSFRHYSVEEGLAQSQIFSVCKDLRGNIWFGTNAGGISIFNGNDFKNLSVKDGIVNNTIQVLHEDSKGNIWIGTDGGLSIHNGYEIKNYTVGMGLSSSKIQSFMEDIQGRMWIGTATGGINIYKEGKFEIIISEDGLLNNNIKALLQDNKGRIWAACYGMGISIFNNEKEINYFSTANGLLDDEVNCLYQDKNGALWIGSEKGITVIQDVSNYESADPDYHMTGYPVSSFFGDELGNIWIGTEGGGILRFDGKNYYTMTEANGLSNNHVFQIVGDNAGGLWVGTDGGGACHFNGDAFLTYSQMSGLSGNMVMAIREDIFGKLWIGTFGNGLTVLDPTNNSNITDFSKAGFTGKYIYAITEDISGQIWIGTHRDGLYKYDGTKFTHYSAKNGLMITDIYSIFQDRNETLWVGGTGGVYMLEGNSFIPFGNEAGLNKDKVLSISDDKNGNIWFATEHGIVCKSDKITTLSERDGLVSNVTSSIIKDKNGNIWIATQNGISYYDGYKFQNFLNRDGLSSGNVYSLVFDDDGNLIAGTEKGIDKISFTEDYKIQRITNYSAEEGFKGIECNLNAVTKDKLGNFWFGTVKGLTKYNPSKELSIEQLPQTHITDISLFFEKANWKNFADSLSRWYNLPVNLQLPYDKNHLTFQFAASSTMGGSERASFQFMLHGFDKNWSPLSAKREVTYSNLPAGKYKLVIRTFFGETESTPVEFDFVVKPAFWNTWWFYFISICVFLTAGYTVIWLRTRNLEKSKRRLAEMVRIRTEEILRQKDELENVSIVARETVQGVLIANKDGKVEWMNDGLQRMTGYGFDEIKIIFGEMLHQISSYPHIHEILRIVSETKQSTQYDSMHLTKDGREQWVTGTVTPVFEHGRLKKIVVIYSDITERIKFEQEINQKNKDITESIMYAKQIQEAVLPQKEKLYKTKPGSFILYLPRDIVSGDFYWFSTRDNILFLAAADCTGHGVPGALMSMIGNEFLYQITNLSNLLEPHQILEELDRRIKQSLRQVGKEKETKDGMDIAFCSINLETNFMQFSGAYRPAIIIRANGDFVELEPEKITIGGYLKYDKSYKTHNVQLQEKDIVYLFTDGYLDQFGGPREKKFLMKRFKELLLNIYKLPMNEQKIEIERAFLNWKGNHFQTDDILVIGFQV